MKKVSFMTLLLAWLVLCPAVSALEKTYIINKNGIEINEQEYRNLVNLGFTENEIQMMKEEEFLANKDLKGEIVAQATTTDIDLNALVRPAGYSPGYEEIPSRILQTTIVAVNGRYRYKVTLQWKNIPSNRSHDIIGIGLEPNVRVFGNTCTFQQNFCYSETNCNSSGTYNQNISSTGVSATYKLPTASVVSMDIYLYYDVVKNTDATITRLNAAGDFAHAMTTVDLDVAFENHLITRGGLYLNSTIYSKYDMIDAAMAYRDVNW